MVVIAHHMEGPMGRFVVGSVRCMARILVHRESGVRRTRALRAVPRSCRGKLRQEAVMARSYMHTTQPVPQAGDAMVWPYTHG
jgi:hypothetical protein